ncbi:hypothetical protein EJB05_58087, partial [Eragrostis curvula]
PRPCRSPEAIRVSATAPPLRPLRPPLDPGSGPSPAPSARSGPWPPVSANRRSFSPSLPVLGFPAAGSTPPAVGVLELAGSAPLRTRKKGAARYAAGDHANPRIRPSRKAIQSAAAEKKVTDLITSSSKKQKPIPSTSKKHSKGGRKLSVGCDTTETENEAPQVASGIPPDNQQRSDSHADDRPNNSIFSPTYHHPKECCLNSKGLDHKCVSFDYAGSLDEQMTHDTMEATLKSGTSHNSGCTNVSFNTRDGLSDHSCALNLQPTGENTILEVNEYSELGSLSSEVSAIYLAMQQSKLECIDEQSQDSTSTEGYAEGEEAEEYDEFDPYAFIKDLPDLSMVVPKFRPVLLPKQTRSCPRTTLVLDLDETLVHSTLEHCPDANFTFPVHFNFREHTIYVRCRPHLMEFLERVASMFETIIFTASQSIYAEQLLNVLDPKRKLFRHRVYRESCVYVEGNYLKDLTVLGRDLTRVMIVDNSPQGLAGKGTLLISTDISLLDQYEKLSPELCGAAVQEMQAFGFQLDNGIPIESWFDDSNDTELLKLLPFLETLVGVEDVRPYIGRKFNLREKVATAPSLAVDMQIICSLHNVPGLPEAQLAPHRRWCRPAVQCSAFAKGEAAAAVLNDLRAQCTAPLLRRLGDAIAAGMRVGVSADGAGEFKMITSHSAPALERCGFLIKCSIGETGVEIHGKGEVACRVIYTTVPYKPTHTQTVVNSSKIPHLLSAMENKAPRSEFWTTMEDLESDNVAANAAAVNHVSALIAGGKLPDPALLRRLIAGLASNMSKPHHEIAVKLGAYSTLNAIWVAITRNQMNMDSSACVMLSTPSSVRRGELVNLWGVQEQLNAVKIIRISLHRSPVNNNARCVTAFASLMVSEYPDVMHACGDALLSLAPVIPDFVFTVTRAYCNLLVASPPQSSLQTIGVAVMLDRLKQISPSMAGHPFFNNLAMDVLQMLANQHLSVRKKVLNLAVCLLTPLNVDSVLQHLRIELGLAASADTPLEYHQMLEEAIRECHSSYPVSIMQFMLDPKCLAFVECINYIKEIMDHNPLLRTQLLMGLLRVLRHVKSSPVCVAAVWAISVCSVSLLEIRSAILAITCLFEDLLDQREILKKITGGGDVQHDYTYYIDHCSGKEGDAQGKHQQPWLMEMEELLFVHLGLTRQRDGSYTIASSSRINTDESLLMPSRLERTDNLTRLVGSGDPFLAEFVGNVLSRLVEMAPTEMKAPRWKAPERGQYKINTDAAIAGATSNGAVGAICKSDNGDFIAASFMIVPNITEPETLEAMACLEALALAEDCNIRRMIVASDCRSVITHQERQGDA